MQKKNKEGSFFFQQKCLNFYQIFFIIWNTISTQLNLKFDKKNKAFKISKIAKIKYFQLIKLKILIKYNSLPRNSNKNE